MNSSHNVFTLALGEFRFSAIDSFEAPSIGDSLWITGNWQAFVLRRAQHERLLLAAATLDETVIGRFSGWLGMTLTVTPDCLYETTYTNQRTEQVQLFDLSFANDPAQLIKTGTLGSALLDGKRFDVYPSGVGATLSVTIVPQH